MVVIEETYIQIIMHSEKRSLKNTAIIVLLYYHNPYTITAERLFGMILTFLKNIVMLLYAYEIKIHMIY